MEIITIALIGFVIGVFSNPIPIFGSLAMNILLISITLAYQQLAEVVSAIPALPLAVFTFSIAFSIGVFTIQMLSVLPIPYVQQIAIMLRGAN